MCACENYEVERQRHNIQIDYIHPGQLFFLGGIRTHDTLQCLQSRRALYQLSYQGNSAGGGSNLQHNTTRGKPQTTVLWRSILSLSMQEQTGVIKPPMTPNSKPSIYACENYEVERQRHNIQINYTQDSSFFPRKNKELPYLIALWLDRAV